MNKSIPIEQILMFGNLPSEAFYKTPQWRKARYQALKVYGNRCQLCGAGPSKGVTIQVDHIKPRSLYPELCLNMGNLQILCSVCHSAKGTIYQDDFRSNFSKKELVDLRDFFRVKRKHLILDLRVPTSTDVNFLFDGIDSINKKHRARWRMFVKYCHREKLIYSDAISTTVADLVASGITNSRAYTKFLSWAGYGKKRDDDLAFDIGGSIFPENIYDLLSDDQR